MRNPPIYRVDQSHRWLADWRFNVCGIQYYSHRRISNSNFHRLSNVVINNRQIQNYTYLCNTWAISLRFQSLKHELQVKIVCQKMNYEPGEINNEIFISCSNAGVSRSATVVLGFLMFTYILPLEDALIIVKKARPCVKPNEGFLQQLRDYEKQLGIWKYK